MRNQGQIFFGAVILVVGLILLFSTIFHVDVGIFFFPTVLILLGTWILVRPYVLHRDSALRMSLFGPVRRDGAWQVTDQEIWLFVGDVRLDCTQAEIPPGETRISIFCFVGDVRLRVPAGVGVSVRSNAFATEAKVLGQKRDGFLSTHLASEGYEAAERKIRLEVMCFVNGVKVEQA